MTNTVLKAIGIITKVSKGYTGIFEELKSRKFVIRFVCSIHNFLRPSFFSTLMIACYGAKSYLALKFRGQEEGAIAITAVTTNELHHAKSLIEAVGKERVIIADIRIRNVFSLSSIQLFLTLFLKLRSIYKFIRIVGHINRRHDFMPACRTASMLGFYFRFLHELRISQPKAIAVVSDYSPDGLGLSCAARNLGIKTIYLLHWYPCKNWYIEPQDFDLTLIPGGAEAIKNYQCLAPVKGKAVSLGIDCKYTAMNCNNLKQQGMNIGIFLTGGVSRNQLEESVAKVQKFLEPKMLILRPHPEILAQINIDFFMQRYDNIKISIHAPLREDIKYCDLVIFGNSSVALEILKSGVPCVYFHGFEESGYDYCGFVEAGLVPEMKDLKDISVDTIKVHYDNEEWIKIFSNFDSIYDKKITRYELIKQSVEELLSDP